MKFAKKGFLVGVFLLLSLLFFTGCSGGTTVDADREEITVFEIIDLSKGDTIAYIQLEDWSGSLPEIAAGEHISLSAYIEEGGEEVLNSDHHALGVSLAEDAEAGIVSIDLQGDHVRIKGEQEGETQVVFQFIHDGDVEYETPPIAVFVVQNNDHGHDGESFGEVAGFEVIHRQDNEVTASFNSWCGDHWHGKLHDLVEGEDDGETRYYGIGFHIEDENGKEIKIDDPAVDLSISIAEGAAEGIVSFDDDGDHFRISGDEPGETQVIFQLEYYGKYFETPPIGLKVE